MPRRTILRGRIAMKKLLFSLLAAILVSGPVFAQGKTAVQILGKNKGTVSSMQAGGHVLVDAVATTKKLGGSVEVFSASKQVKVAFPGMYAILSAPLKEVIINATTVPLNAEVVVTGGKLYAPVQFFMLPQVQKALDRQIAFENNTLVVEKNFTLAFTTQEQKADYDKIHLQRAGNITFHSKQVNKHTVEVTFPNTVLKRNISQRPKDNFIRSFTLNQVGKDVVLKVILGTQGKAWKMAEENGGLVLSVSAKALPASAAPQTATSLAVSTGEEDAEELDLNPSVTEDTPSAATPVIKPAPVPTISAAALPTMSAKRDIHIVIDPGHGGKDSGAVRKGSAKEKDLNLTVAKHLYNYLKKQGFDVKLTRTDDTFVTLAGRSKMANEYKADLFISVHTNAAKRSQANGFEVYFRSEKPTDKDAADIAAFENEALQYEEAHYSFVDKLLQSLAKNEYMNESSKLASHVRNYVYKEPGIGIAVNQKNAVKQANFYVLRGVQAPAILVEMGYISSPKDKARLNNKAAQKRMGEGIGKGVMVYLKEEGRIK